MISIEIIFPFLFQRFNMYIFNRNFFLYKSIEKFNSRFLFNFNNNEQKCLIMLKNVDFKCDEFCF